MAPTQIQYYREWRDRRSADSHGQDHGSPQAKQDGFSEHHHHHHHQQQTFTIETMMTAHAYLLLS
jgi:hypothetical protein